MKKILLLIILNFSILSASQVGIVHGLDPYGDGFLSLRNKPKGTEIGRLYNNNEVVILGKRGKWYKVKDTRSHRKGWVFGKWIKIKRQYKTKNTSKCTNYVVTIRQLNIRDRPGKQSHILGSVRRGDKVCIYRFSGKWGRSDYGWISGKYLSRLNQYDSDQEKFDPIIEKISKESSAALSVNKTSLDKDAIEYFGKLIIRDKLDTYDSNQLGLQLLKTEHPRKYANVKNNEFELDDAKKWALDNFNNILKGVNKDMDYHLSFEVKFGKYDFKTERFPIYDAIQKDSLHKFTGKDKFVSMTEVSFKNAINDVNFIEIGKDKAEKFLKTRKNNYGNIDRGLTAHYLFNILECKEKTEHKITQSGNISPMTLHCTAKLKSVEFKDEKQKHVLKKVEFSEIENDNFSVETEKVKLDKVEEKEIIKVEQKKVEEAPEQDDFEMPDEE